MNTTSEDRTKLLLPGLYAAAGQELAQRIQTRELVLVTYMAFSVALLGAGWANAGAKELALALPILAVACALLSAHHDAIIGLLSDYMGELTSEVEVVRWHDPSGYLGRALQARHIRDIASICYLLLTVAVALYVSFAAAQPYGSLSLLSMLWWAGALCLVAIPCVYSLLRTFRHKLWPFNKNAQPGSQAGRATGGPLLHSLGVTIISEQSMSPQTSNPDPDMEDVRKAYEATVNYHNTLVQMRFAVASFFAAAAAFLVGAVFAESSWLPTKKVVSGLGLIVTLIVWLLEMRTYCLLRNLGKIGLEYEAKFKLGGSTGFFSLMSKEQPLGIRVPFLRIELPSSSFVRRVFSHSFGLDAFYLSFVVFWAYTLIVAICP